MNLCVDDIEKFGRLFKPRRKLVTIAFRNVASSRHFAAAQQFGRFLSEADIIRQAKPAELVENDPHRKSCLSQVSP